MARLESRADYLDVVKADLLLKDSLEVMEQAMHIPEPKKLQPPPMEMDPKQTWIILVHSGSSERAVCQLKFAAVSYTPDRRIVHREEFGTQKTPDSSKFFHEVCTWDDTSGKIINFRRVELILQGKEIITHGSLDDIEDSVDRLTQVVGQNVEPLREDSSPYKTITRTSL